MGTTKLKHRYIIGTNVMFYELAMLEEYVHSLLKSVESLDEASRLGITFQFNLNSDTKYETFADDYFGCTGTIEDKRSHFEDHAKEMIQVLKDADCHVQVVHTRTSVLGSTMVEYRRTLNSRGCKTHDFVVWGETDCLIPSQFFLELDEAVCELERLGIRRSIVTLATRKMWDASWLALEHQNLTNDEYLERDDSRIPYTPTSIHYTMSWQEMEDFNSKHSQPRNWRLLDHPKFDGSILCISSELIGCGANIPDGFWGLSAEDTAFMYSAQQVMGKNYRQLVIANLLKVHNRSHPKKRIGCVQHDGSPTDQWNKGELYDRVRQQNRENLGAMFNHSIPQIPLTWKLNQDS